MSGPQIKPPRSKVKIDRVTLVTWDLILDNTRGRYKPAKGHYVYFVTGANAKSLIKIGRTTGDISKRLKMLQTGSPVPLRLLAWMPGDCNLELHLHRSFGGYRRHGEWFARSDELMAVIELARRTFCS